MRWFSSIVKVWRMKQKANFCPTDCGTPHHHLHRKWFTVEDGFPNGFRLKQPGNDSPEAEEGVCQMVVVTAVLQAKPGKEREKIAAISPPGLSQSL
jgi:hypothetical protein